MVMILQIYLIPKINCACTLNIYTALNILVNNVDINMMIGILCHTGGRLHLNTSPYSITLNLLEKLKSLILNMKLLWSHYLKPLIRKATFFSFFALFVFSFFSFQFPEILSLRIYFVFFSLTFPFVWVDFASFALSTSFSADCSGESPAFLLSCLIIRL